MSSARNLLSLVIAVVYLVLTAALEGLNVLAAFLMVYGLHQLVYGAIVKHIQALKSELAEQVGDEPKHLAE